MTAEETKYFIELYGPMSLAELVANYRSAEYDAQDQNPESLANLPCGEQDRLAELRDWAESVKPLILKAIAKFPLDERIMIPHYIFVACDKLASELADAEAYKEGLEDLADRNYSRSEKWMES